MITSLHKKKSLLVIEDDEVQRQLIKMYLSEYQVDVLIVSTAGQGLEIARNQQLDIIISDCYLPDMDILEFLRIVKSDQRLERTPVLLMTASLDEELKVNILAAGAERCMSKPMGKKEWAQIIDELDNFSAH